MKTTALSIAAIIFCPVLVCAQQIKMAWDPSPVATDTYNAYRNVIASFSPANKINANPITAPSLSDSCSSGTRCYYAVTASGLRDASNTDKTQVLKESAYSNILAIVVDGANRVWSLGPEPNAYGTAWKIYLNGAQWYDAFGVEIAAVNGICYVLGDEAVNPVWWYFDFAMSTWTSTGSPTLPDSTTNQAPIVTVTATPSGS